MGRDWWLQEGSALLMNDSGPSFSTGPIKIDGAHKINRLTEGREFNHAMGRRKLQR